AHATVAVVGCGGLGGPAARTLADHGVGRLCLLDDDLVELSNLPRQLHFDRADLGHSKSGRLAARLAAAFPGIDCEGLPCRLAADNAEELLAGCDFVVDATDNVASKYLLNDLLVRQGTPFVHAGVTGMLAQLLTVLPGRSPCLRCLFPASEDAGETAGCQHAGVIGPLPALIGTLQGLEAVKVLSAAGNPITGRLLLYDAGTGVWRSVTASVDPSCSACALAGFR
ncbi:MAG TPA: HesA/MoeB/ThiF family protein, partial [Terriglobales bacterium]|nr:HesA/MoeB/ThiF family protein [Terriglobales bacterium]